MKFRRHLYYILWLLIVTVACSIATEFFAYNLGYEPSLGGKLFGGFYFPYQIFLWNMKYGATGNLYEKAYMIIGIVAVIAGVGILILYNRINKKVSDTYGSSRYGTTNEMKKLGLIKSDPTGCAILCQSNKAKFKYKHKKDKWIMKKSGKLICIDKSNRHNTHLAALAYTRAGKGINLIIPTLLSWNQSVFVYDIKKENYNVTAGWRKKFSHVIKFEPANPECSAKYNPLDEILLGSNSEIATAQNIAEIIANPDGKDNNKGDPFWENNGIILLTCLILHVLYSEKEKSLYGIYKYITNPEWENTKDMFINMLNTKHLEECVHPNIAEMAAVMKNAAENTLSGFILQVISYLKIFADPVVSKNMSSSDFKITDLMQRKRPVSLYLVVNPEDKKRMNPVTRLMLQMIGKKLCRKLGDYKNKLLMIFDEFISLGKIDFVEDQIAYFAGYGIRLFLITQSFNQIFNLYGANTSILDNCKYKVIFGSYTPNEAKLIAEYLGQKTILKTNENKSGKLATGLMTGISKNTQEVGRNLMTYDEVMRLSYDDIILLIGGSYPYLGKKIFYFDDYRFKDRANITPPESIKEQMLQLIFDDDEGILSKDELYEEDLEDWNYRLAKAVEEDKLLSYNTKKADQSATPEGFNKNSMEEQNRLDEDVNGDEIMEDNFEYDDGMTPKERELYEDLLEHRKKKGVKVESYEHVPQEDEEDELDVDNIFDALNY